MVGRILDRDKFLESHRQAVLFSVGRVRDAYLDRLKEYAFDNGLKICRNCYRVYEKDCAECGKGVEY